MLSEIPKKWINIFRNKRFVFSSSQALLYLVLALGLLRFLSLGFYPLMDTTEARYGEIARIMAELNDWVTPWFDYGVPFWGKPPLSFWLTALSFKVFGINELAARLPHFLCAVTVTWFVWDLGKRNSYNEALYAVVLLWACALFFISSGVVMTDMVLILGTTLSMRSFWISLHAEGLEQRREKWLFFIGLGVSLLAKGPIGFLLTLIPLLLWTWRTEQSLKVRNSFPWAGGLVLTLVIAAPWYLLAEIRTPGFLDYFLIGEHWDRFFVPGWKGDLYGSGHHYARGTIWLFYLADFLPWTLLIPGYLLISYWKRLEDQRSHNTQQIWTLYLFLWAICPAFFFSLARNILWPYVLPGFPALALLVSAWLTRFKNQKPVQKMLIQGLLTTLFLSILISASPILQSRIQNTSAKMIVREYEKYKRPEDQLFFFGKRSFSADFYSKGRAEFIPDLQSLERRLEKDQGFIVFKNTFNNVAIKSQLEKLTLVTRQGGYSLYKIKIP